MEKEQRNTNFDRSLHAVSDAFTQAANEGSISSSSEVAWCEAPLAQRECQLPGFAHFVRALPGSYYLDDDLQPVGSLLGGEG